MKKLGFTGKITELINISDLSGFELGRVIIEHKERYKIQSEHGILNAEITGNLRFSANSRTDFPAVGDWVKFAKTDSENSIIIEVLPRISSLARQAVGKFGEIQLIATNIDFGFIVQSVGHDFNLNRLERYVTICNSSKIKPIVVLSKIDLIEPKEIEQNSKELRSRFTNMEIVLLSNKTKSGFEQLNSLMKPFYTYCFMGSSGVGKSTIVNHLKGDDVLKTNEISNSTGKGKHTTSHRELFVLRNKSIVIDTPGMREIGISDDGEGIELTYLEISDLANNCKFKNCSHISENGCAVLDAIEKGTISEEAYRNYQKLRKEQNHFSSSVYEKRQKDRQLGKLYKTIQNEKRKNKLNN